MKMLHRTRLAVAVLAMGALGLGSVAQADPFVGRLIGSVAAGMLVNGAMKSHDKKFAAQCRLYDREGMEVYLPCDSRRPLGEVLVADRTEAMADGLAGGPPPPADIAALYEPAAPHEAYTQYQEGPAAYGAPVHAGRAPAYAPPPVRYAAPMEADCGCEHEFREARAHPVASFLSARGGQSQTSYRAGRVVGVYDAYAESSGGGAVSYSESYGDGYSSGYAGGGYGYGFTGGVGHSGGFYPYGGVGYGAGGYGDGYARAAGRDQNGFLTWPGKRVR